MIAQNCFLYCLLPTAVASAVGLQTDEIETKFLHANSILEFSHSLGPSRRATSGWLSVAFGAKRKWRYHHSHAPLPAALDHRGAQQCVLHREGRHGGVARLFLFR